MSITPINSFVCQCIADYQNKDLFPVFNHGDLRMATLAEWNKNGKVSMIYIVENTHTNYSFSATTFNKHFKEVK